MARGIVIKIEGDGESAKRALEMVREQLKETGERAKHEASEIGEAMERVKVALEYTGIYLGIREVIDGLKELVGGSLELGESMEKASKRTGLAVDTLSVLHYAAAITGSDFDGLVSGISKMDRTIGLAADGNKKASGFVRALGLDAKDLAGKTNGAEIAFHAFVQTLAATESPIRRNELAMGLLGKAGSAQIPVLIEIAEHWDEFKAKAEAAGVVLTADTAKALAETNQRLQDMKQNITGAGLALTEGMAPGLTQIFSIISGGKSQLDQMNLMGQNLAKTFAFVGEVIYSAAAAAEGMFGTFEGGKFTKAGRTDLAAYEELKRKAEEMHTLAFGKGAPQLKPIIDGLTGPGGKGGFEGSDEGGKAHSDDPIVRAAAELAAEQAKAKADARKTSDELQLTELETQHKLLLVTDQEYFAEKLRLQDDALDAEAESLKAKGTTLQALLEKQKADGLLRKDKDGNSAEALRTQKELLQVQEQLAAITVRRAKDSGSNTTEYTAAERAAEISSLKVMAELEKQRNEGISAQIALVRREKDEEARKSTAGGGSEDDAAAIRAAGELEVAKLRIKEVTDDITRSENENKRAVQELTDAAEKDPRFKKAATAQINALNKAEAEQLRTLVAQYDALAQELGGPFLETAKNLHAEIDKLSRPDNKSDAAFAKTLASGVESMADKIVESATRGKASFSSMVQSMGDDVLRLALKLAEQKWLTPLLEGIIGGGGGGSAPDVPFSMFDSLGIPGRAEGGPASGLTLVGEKGPELVDFTSPAMVHSNSMSTKIADAASGGGNGKGVSIVSNVINQTSQPVTAQPSQVSYDSEMKQFIVHTVLTDMNQGGPIGQAIQK